MLLSCRHAVASHQLSWYIWYTSDESGVTADSNDEETASVDSSLESCNVTCCALSFRPDGVKTTMRGLLWWLSRCRSSLDRRINWAPHSAQGHITTVTGVTSSPLPTPGASKVDAVTPFMLCRVMCALRLLLCENDRSQTPQTNGFSPVWVRVWRRRLDSWVNDRRHSSHSNGRSPVCVRRCILSTLLSAKPRWHTKQTNRRRLCSSVLLSWLRMCLYKLLLWVNERLHCVQTYGRSPLCRRRWAFRLLHWAKLRLQVSQTNGRSPVCVRSCLFKFDD